MNPRTPISSPRRAHRPDDAAPSGAAPHDTILSVRAIPARSTLQLGPGWAIYCGEAGDNAWHAHHALQVTIGVRGNVIASLAGADDVVARGVVIGPDRPHRLLGNGTPVLSIYLDGHGSVGRALTACADGLQRLDDTTANAIIALSRDEPDGAAIGQALLAHWQSELPAAPARATTQAAAAQRVRQLLDQLTHSTWHDVALDLASLAARAALSPSHFAQCLRTETGLPLRAWLRWQRLQRAVAAALAGATLTQAAHEAGFADAAHLTRTFRRHFGLAPSTIFTHVSAGVPTIHSSAGA